MLSVREGGLLVRWCCCVRIREEERNKNKEQGIEKEEKEMNFLVQPREYKGEILWGTCLTKERKCYDPPFQLSAFITFHPPIVLYSRKAQIIKQLCTCILTLIKLLSTTLKEHISSIISQYQSFMHLK